MIDYPRSRKEHVSDTYFGQQVADPYRWLENDQSEETKTWVIAENQVTEAYLSQIPYRQKIRQRLEQLWNYEKYGAPFKEGRFIYFFKNDGLQNQAVLYRQEEGKEPEVFLDPNQFSADGTTSLASIEFSRDGSLAAYQISVGGSDWRSIIVIRTEDKTPVGVPLQNVKFSGVAWKGNEGFYYSSYDQPKDGRQLSGLTQHHKLFYHRLETSQDQDKLIFGGELKPRRYIGAYTTEDEHYLVITAANSTSGNELYIQDLTSGCEEIVTVVDNMDNDHDVLINRGKQLFILTNLFAPNRRVVTVDASDAGPSNWKVLIPETKDVLNADTGGGKIFASYLKDATSMILQYSMEGKQERVISLPGLGTAQGFSCKASEKELYYTFTSYVNPPVIFKYSIETGTSALYKKSQVQFDPQQFESEQVFYTSADGTKIPMIITCKKGLPKNGANPLLLYGYGGFGVSLTPSFSTSNIIFLEQGGIFAVPNIRGGGEYGEDWHRAGTKFQKQNVFDDFIAAAEYLIDHKYTSSSFLAIAGGSNGGLLVGACMTRRPDLFKVALPAVGVLDMLRYHRFTAGAGWAYDYGTAEDSKEMFEYLLSYSPYHALKPGVAYPATLITTADHDDRVVPAHSFKFAARLQEMHQGDNPVLIRIDTKAGHGAGKSTAQIIAEQTDKWAFLFYTMGIALTDHT